MQSPDNLSLSSSSSSAGGPGYQRVRTQTDDNITTRDDHEVSNTNNTIGIAEINHIGGMNDHDDDDEEEDLERRLSPSSSKNVDGYQQVINQEQPPNLLPSSPQQLRHPQKQSMNAMHKRSNSWGVDIDDGGDLFDDEEEEDAQVVRRYAYRNRIPIVPAEFSHQPFPRRLWQSFVELRTAARQRRAARLLNNSQYTPTTHCILTWCCDATDRGIALVAILLILWLILGWTNKMFRGYWLLGMILFIVRVSARRVYESITARAAKRRGGGAHNPRVPSGSPSSPTSSPSSPSITSSVEMKNDYRDHA